MAYDTANTYETIELFGLTEKDAQLPIPEDHVLTDRIIRESFETLLGQLRNTGLEAEIEPLAHGLATILQALLQYGNLVCALQIVKQIIEVDRRS